MFDPEINQTTEEESEKSQVKDFLSRAEIRTMKKDLQKLREAVALKERERIINLKSPLSSQAKKEGLKLADQKPVERNLNQNQPMGNMKIFQQKKEEEEKGIEEMKKYTQETEKQQILYLEEEKKDLAGRLEILEKQKEPPLLLEKNRSALKKDEIQKRLKVILGEEKNVEDEEKLIGEGEKTATLPSDRQKLEKKRWEIEEKRQASEKRTWAVERELEIAEKQLKTAEEECQKVVEEENELKNKIAGIDASLRSIYSGVMVREQKRIAMEKEKKDAESLKQAAVVSREKEGIMEKEWAGRGETSNLAFLNKLPENAKKERLKNMIEDTAGEEEAQRRKFLENVEKWSEERKSKSPNDINTPPAPKPGPGPNKN